MGSVSQLVEYVLNPTLGLMGRNISISSSLLEAEKALNLLRPKECVGGMMRVGSGEDGGYLIPNQMELPSGLISPGVAEDSSFELHFAKQGVECLLIDGSVDGPPVDHPKFSFRKEWVTAYTTPGETISLTDLISSLSQKKGGGQDLVLQMDIEGSEYEVLLATQEETLNNFQLIVIELHGLENISNPMGLEIIGKSLRKLTANHEVVHFHPNNCCGQFRFGSMRFPRVVEVTLVRKDLGITTKDLAQLPHPLDTPNVTTKSDIRVTWPAIRKP